MGLESASGFTTQKQRGLGEYTTRLVARLPDQGLHGQGGTPVYITFERHSALTEDIAITHFVVEESGRSKGAGTLALSEFLAWCKKQGYKDIRATQVQRSAVDFWVKSGFVRLPEPNYTSDYQYRG